MRHSLAELRGALLDLHKVLVDSERVSYEKTIGAIQSPNHFLQLLTGDPWFAWLQPLSQLIVAMDEALEEKEPLTPDLAAALVKRAPPARRLRERGRISQTLLRRAATRPGCGPGPRPSGPILVGLQPESPSY